MLFKNFYLEACKGLSTNSFCHALQIFSVKEPPPPPLHPPSVLNGQYQDGQNTSHKRKICAVSTLYFKFWRYFLKIFVRYLQPLDLLFIVVFIRPTFTSADIIFHKFLKHHHSALSEKKIFVMNFSFVVDSINPLTHPLNGQNLPKHGKSFFVVLPKVFPGHNQQ